MAHEVYANKMAVVAKSADGKSICAFPDVCLSPPSPPAGPIPIPYPNTGFASDTTSGSKSVKLKGKEICLKNKSYFKKSTGDEPATKSLGMGVITHTIQGKVYFNSWSMDVKVEGENVCRFGDLTTHNHMSPPGNSPPWPYTDRIAMALDLDDCKGDRQKAEDACKNNPGGRPKCPSNKGIKKAEKARAKAKAKAGKNYASDSAYLAANANVTKAYEDFAKEVNKDDCAVALRCFLVPYDKTKKGGCCPGQTGDHLVDAASFLDEAEASGQARDKRPKITGWKKYDVNKAPCMCAEGPNQTTATHGKLHTRRGVVALQKRDANGQWTIQQATAAGAKAAVKTFPESKCSQACIEAQLNKYHNSAKTTDPPKPINAAAPMTGDEAERNAARRDMGVPIPKGSTR